MPRSLLVALLLAACGAPRTAIRMEPEDGRPGPPLVLVLSEEARPDADLIVYRVTLQNRSLDAVDPVLPLRLALLGEDREPRATALPPDEGAEAVLLATPPDERDPSRAAELAAAALRGPIPPGEARTGLVVVRGVTFASWVALDVRDGRGVMRLLGRLGP